MSRRLSKQIADFAQEFFELLGFVLTQCRREFFIEGFEVFVNGVEQVQTGI